MDKLDRADSRARRSEGPVMWNRNTDGVAKMRGVDVSLRRLFVDRLASERGDVMVR